VRVAALLLGFGVAAVCFRLGLWQMERHGERRAWNAQVEARLAATPVLLTSGSTGAETDSLAYRRARAAGTFAFADQTVEVNRSHQGVPGVFVMTPLRLADGTAILVNRGWTFAPDGMTVDAGALVEPESSLVDGILLAPAGRFAVRPESLGLGYPLFPLVLRRTQAAPGMPRGLTPADLPPRDRGPHLSYAFQWFAFAVIAAVGGSILAHRAGSARRIDNTPRSPQSRSTSSPGRSRP
jgi:surfeit locus 1 family protein